MESSPQLSTSSTPLSHQEVQKILLALGDAGLFNLDASIRSFIEPVARALGDGDTTTQLHALCCNEYFAVTQ